MTDVHPKAFLDDQFPKHLRPLIPTTLNSAYVAASQVIDDEPILQVPSARDNRGRIVSWSVDSAFVRAMESGRLPFDFRWKPFAKPTGRYLEIRLGHSVLTISLVHFPDRQPRSVVYRERNRRLNGQLELLRELERPVPIEGLPHVLLIHGYRDPQFAHLGIPAHDDPIEFTYRTNNLFNLPHEIEPEGPPPENTDIDFDAMRLLKEDIDKWRRDHGDE